MRTNTLALALLLSAFMTAAAQDSTAVFRGVQWGMSMQGVMESEEGKAEFVREETDTLFPLLTSLYFETRLADIPVVIDCHFFNDSLYHIWVHGTRDYWEKPESGISDFYTLMNALHARYDSLSSYYARNDNDSKYLDSSSALILGERTYSATFKHFDGTEIHLYYDRAGYDDDVPRQKKLDLWFGIVSYDDPIHDRADAYKSAVLDGIQAAKDAAEQREIDAARAEGEKNAVDF